MNSILVVGSVAFDSLKTPFGEAARIVGGAATYFSVAASFFTDVRIVAVVGDDFGEEQMRIFGGRRIDTDGLQRVNGETFRWKGEYSFDLNDRRDDLHAPERVRATSNRSSRQHYRDSPFVFLGNIQPHAAGGRARPGEQAAPGGGRHDELLDRAHAGRSAQAVLTRVDVLLINDAEARQLSGEWNLVKAARAVRAMGPRLLVIKRGEYGVLMSRDGRVLRGAGHAARGGVRSNRRGRHVCRWVSGLSRRPAARCRMTALARAIIAGSTMASFAVEDFGLERLLRLTQAEVKQRFGEFKRLTHFEEL